MTTATTITKEDLHAGFQTIRAIADTIQEVQEIPSGKLYAMLMSHGLTILQYEKIIGILQRAGLITVKNHLIKWIA
jgi:hypothetical protein